jgi:lipopolysaccharide/colanic/teichoic acid biosynthesis glycosyltransferase
MLARSSDLTNRNADRVAVRALSCSLLPRFESLAFAADFDLHSANSAQITASGVQSPAFGNYAGIRSGGEPPQEAIPGVGAFAKRVIDVLLSSIAVLLLWPLMLAIAVVVKLESRGPVIYPSWRAGERGVPFPCYKFRTMVPEADAQRKDLRHLNQRRGPFFKIANDPRVTRLGRFLRKHSLDELPQFWNVLKGEMSLVGPRPHPLEDVEQYGPEHEQRLGVKPGMTGLWQVLARNNPSFDVCLLLDVGYIRHWSLLLDCKILLRTLPAVFAGEGQ